MKSFDHRNDLKKQLELTPTRQFYISPKEVRYVHLGTNLKTEQDGKGKQFTRPVLVMKKLGSLFRVIPMTSREFLRPDTERFYYTLPHHYFNKTSRLILTQFRTLDKVRFIEKIGRVESEVF